MRVARAVRGAAPWVVVFVFVVDVLFVGVRMRALPTWLAGSLDVTTWAARADVMLHYAGPLLVVVAVLAGATVDRRRPLATSLTLGLIAAGVLTIGETWLSLDYRPSTVSERVDLMRYYAAAQAAPLVTAWVASGLLLGAARVGRRTPMGGLWVGLALVTVGHALASGAQLGVARGWVPQGAWPAVAVALVALDGLMLLALTASAGMSLRRALRTGRARSLAIAIGASLPIAMVIALVAVDLPHTFGSRRRSRASHIAGRVDTSGITPSDGGRVSDGSIPRAVAVVDPDGTMHIIVEDRAATLDSGSMARLDVGDLMLLMAADTRADELLRAAQRIAPPTRLYVGHVHRLGLSWATTQRLAVAADAELTVEWQRLYREGEHIPSAIMTSGGVTPVRCLDLSASRRPLGALSGATCLTGVRSATGTYEVPGAWRSASGANVHRAILTWSERLALALAVGLIALIALRLGPRGRALIRRAVVRISLLGVCAVALSWLVGS